MLGFGFCFLPSVEFPMTLSLDEGLHAYATVLIWIDNSLLLQVKAHRDCVFKKLLLALFLGVCMP